MEGGRVSRPFRPLNGPLNLNHVSQRLLPAWIQPLRLPFRQRLTGIDLKKIE